jgi:alkyl hydroperoxide reductase subunit AhpC
VCPTEITAFSDRIKEFEAIGCNVSQRCMCVTSSMQ